MVWWILSNYFMRYYGGKEKLLGVIEDGVKSTELNHGAKFVDLFAGTSVVSRHFKRLGYTVISNDFMEFSHAFAKTYVELNREPAFAKLRGYLKIVPAVSFNAIDYLNGMLPVRGFVSSHYCPGGEAGRMYFSDSNGQKIDAVREKIQEWRDADVVSESEYYYLITALLEAVNRVSNVAGTYAAYLKKWDARALKPLTLAAPVIIPSKRKNKAFKQDANQIVREIRNIDILYLDPPYNGRQYASNYFLLELIAEGWFNGNLPRPEGKAGMPTGGQQISEYCYKGRSRVALADLVDNAHAKYILLSYSNEGIIDGGGVRDILASKGEVRVFTKQHKRYKSVNQSPADPQSTEERLYRVETELATKRANKLDGQTWLQHSFSIWADIAKSQEEQRLQHPAIFPVQLGERIIDILTNGSGKNILDCFAGSGSTLIAGMKKGMNVCGVDVSEEFRALFHKRVDSDFSQYRQGVEIRYHVDDARRIGGIIPEQSIDLCLTSPPYWDILNARRTADLKTGRNYTDMAQDIGNIAHYADFLRELKAIMGGVALTLRPGGYCAVVVMDLRKGGKFYPLHSDVAGLMQEIGFSFEDMIIWNRQKEYNNCKPLGYPYKFIVNKIHEYILIFRK